MDTISAALQSCREQIEEALVHGGCTHNFSDVEDCIRAGTAQLWLDEKGPGSLVITEVLRHPNFSEVRCWIVAGQMDRVLAISERIVSWAREIGAVRVTGVGRGGWARVLKQRGWKQVYTVVAKDTRQ